MPLNSIQQTTKTSVNVIEDADLISSESSAAITLSKEESEEALVNKAVSLEKSKLEIQREEQIKIAKQKHLESIKNNKATNDALLKGQVFNDELEAIKQAQATARIEREKFLKTQQKLAQAKKAEQNDSIASILPISAPVPETNKSSARITIKKVVAKEEPQAIKPRITIKPKLLPKESSQPETKKLNANHVNIQSTAAVSTVSTPITATSANINTTSKTEQKTIPETTAKVRQAQSKAIATKAVETNSTPKEKAKRTFKPQAVAVNNIPNTEGNLQSAVAVSGNKPDYPQMAQQNKLEGKVIAKMIVMVDGKTQGAEIIQSSGHAVLDNEVLEFINRELFMPSLEGEEKVTSEQLFSYQFKSGSKSE
ncbi:energy transducer TonB [Psychromonas algarum]|uniref:energy transducer TonB n=1 Tax=Psychromonas algarum TaxID=2555643 RepID=UPI0014194B0E|nr:energy transducer TonB [Psychromonas sp. RZ22]